MKKERYIFMIKLWDSLKSKTQQMLLEQENEELKWEQKYKKEHKLRQEAEGEMSILKTISVHSSPEMRDAKEKIKDLQSHIDRIKKENNELYNRIAKLTEENLQKARESGL
jgi:hypothetical protein